MKFVGLRRIASRGDDVAESPQAVTLLRAKTQPLRKLMAFLCGGFGRFAIDVDEGCRSDAQQFRFNSAMSARPCNAKRALGDIEGSFGVPRRERLAEQCARQRGEILRVNLLRSVESGFQQWDGGLEFPGKDLDRARANAEPVDAKARGRPFTSSNRKSGAPGGESSL
jgi:hypothetical protein